MSNQTNPTCAECAFAEAFTGPQFKGGLAAFDGYRCRRFPPLTSRARGIPQSEDPLPHVTASDWCGEFTPSEPEETAVKMEWRELNQLDPEAKLTLSALPVEAEFKDLEEGGAWHPVHDHIFEMEEACPGNTGDHIRAGLRVRVPLPALSKLAVDYYRGHVERLSEGRSDNGKYYEPRGEEPNPILEALRELESAGLLRLVEVTSHGDASPCFSVIPN